MFSCICIHRVSGCLNQERPFGNTLVRYHNDITQTTEVSTQPYLQFIGKSVTGIICLFYLTHQHTWREYGRETARLHPLTEFETGVTRHILNISHRRITTVPVQVTEVITVADGTTDTRRRCIQRRDDHRIVIRNHIHDTYHTITSGHTHIHLDTICTSFVDCHQVVRLIYRIVNHLCRNQLVLV